MAGGSCRRGLCCLGFLLWLLQSCAVSYGGRKLRMVNVVYRHGDRSPAHFFPTDEHKNYWPQGPGQLTQIGMKQEYALGRFLRERYVNNTELLNSSYLFKEIYVRSSDKDRCIMSAQTQLNGLYPPHGKQPISLVKGVITWTKRFTRWCLKIWRGHLDWQPIGVHVVPRNEDYAVACKCCYYGDIKFCEQCKLLRPFDYNCPRFYELIKKSKQDPEYVDMAKKNKEVLAYVSLRAGKKVTLDNAHEIHDALFCEKSHNLTLPSWATNGTTWEALTNMSDFEMTWAFNTPEKAKLTGGSLVGAIVNNMKSHLEQTSKKLYIYSAHDTTVSALLSALKVFDGITPAYSSAVMIELYSDQDDDKKDLTVRILYRFGQSTDPRVLRLSNCSEFCPLGQFIEKTADIIPSDIDKACGVEEAEKCVKTIIYKSFLAAFIAVTVLLSLLLLILCIRCCRRRCCRPQNNLTVYNDLLKDARLLDKPDYDSDN